MVIGNELILNCLRSLGALQHLCVASAGTLTHRQVLIMLKGVLLDFCLTFYEATTLRLLKFPANSAFIVVSVAKFLPSSIVLNLFCKQIVEILPTGDII